MFARLEAMHWLERLTRDELVPAVAEFYGDLNVVHPFRDGNGRAQRLLFEQLVINAGYRIDWWPITVDAWLQANIDAVVCNYRGLEKIFDQCIGAPIAG